MESHAYPPILTVPNFLDIKSLEEAGLLQLGIRDLALNLGEHE